MTKAAIGKNDRAVAYWLFAGVILIMIQVLLGGITRLTESGLSITEWNPITGALPPLSETAWQQEFDKYRKTDQFRYIHADFTLSNFKFIFFWEWFHRLWARFMGLVFLAGFGWFLIRKKFRKEMVLPLLILFLLGALQGAIGWIMVKSGLVPEKYFVGHIELATHFIAALVLLLYTFWFALRLTVHVDLQPKDQASFNLGLAVLILLFVQLTYGAFMAGLKAAPYAPTWPTINGAWMPSRPAGVEAYWLNHPIGVQFIHRGLAYLLSILIIIWYFQTRRKAEGSDAAQQIKWPLLLVLAQTVLGILTVLNAPYAEALLWLGVAHQFTGMLLLIAVFFNVYIQRLRPLAYI